MQADGAGDAGSSPARVTNQYTFIMKENWKPIGNYKYEVSDLGRVRISSSGKILKPYTDRQQEYDRVDLYEDGRRHKAMIHTLVAAEFIGPLPEGYEIDHLNTNIHDNRACNLKYVTRAENQNNPITIFNREVARIKRSINSGKRSQEDILRMVRVLKAI